MVRSRPVAVLLTACLLGGGWLGGCSPSFLVTPVQSPATLDETTVVDGHGLFPDKIAVIPVEGTLANVPAAGGLLGAGENPLGQFVQELDEAAKDDRVKAVVLRVNSPGGTVSGSDAMYQELLRFRAKTHKPVVASGQEVVASGAYYVCCGADRIVAQPTTLVGSIGVIFETVNVKGTLDKIGVGTRAYTSAAHKDIGSPFRPATADEEVIFQDLVNEYFARFKGIVTEHRPIPATADFGQITDGRVFSGQAAAKLGLVDQVGLLEDAVALAKKLGHAGDGAEVVMYRHPYANTGSIYAASDVAPPRADGKLTLQLPEAATMLPAGFYYLWRP